jgi:tetratricopeptide (TPR) repeat protein
MLRFFLLAVLCGGAMRAETVLAIPFFNHTSEANLNWIGESIAESVRDSLASEGLLVLDREDRMEAYRRLSLRPGAELTHASVIKLGEALDASRVIYGEYELMEPSAAPTAAAPGAPPSRGSIRITAHILDLKQLHLSAPMSQTGAFEDLAAIESRMGWQALETLRPKTAPSQEEFLKARPPVRIDAVESYIRGLLSTSPEQRHRLFTQAARLDGHYSQPCFQLARISWEKKDYKTAENWFVRVGQKDPHYLESQFFLGLSRFHSGDFEGAEKSFELVAASMPLNEVYNNLGAVQDRRGNFTAAIANFRKAMEGDDSDPDFHFNLGYSQWHAGQFDAAAASFRDVLARDPNDADATSLLALASQKRGPRPGDPKTEGRMRLKNNYDEAAYRQLQMELTK